MVDTRFDDHDPTTQSLPQLLKLDLAALGTKDLQTIEFRAKYAFMRLSCRETTSPSQKDRMTQWQVLKTRCSAELHERNQGKIYSRQTSYAGSTKTDTTLALAWHERLFDNAT